MFCPTQAASFLSLWEQMETEPRNGRWSNYWNEQLWCTTDQELGVFPLQEVYPAALSSSTVQAVIKQAQCHRSGWTVTLVDLAPSAEWGEGECELGEFRREAELWMCGASIIWHALYILSNILIYENYCYLYSGMDLYHSNQPKMNDALYNQVQLLLSFGKT